MKGNDIFLHQNCELFCQNTSLFVNTDFRTVHSGHICKEPSSFWLPEDWQKVLNQNIESKGIWSSLEPLMMYLDLVWQHSLSKNLGLTFLVWNWKIRMKCSKKQAGLVSRPWVIYQKVRKLKKNTRTEIEMRWVIRKRSWSMRISVKETEQFCWHQLSILNK